jgi:hypothetical protein
MRCEKHIQNVGRKTLKRNGHLEDTVGAEKTILRWISGKYGVSVWTGFIWFWMGARGKPWRTSSFFTSAGVFRGREETQLL